jgi:hypothetical protein
VIRVALTTAVLIGTASMTYVGAGVSRPEPPRLLSDTGIDDPRTRPFTPQYPLWSDGALKSRRVLLPEGARIDATDVDAWEFPSGTRFWKEFEFAGRKVETRMLWKAGDEWVFATYVWNDAQTDAVLAPAGGLPGVVEVAPGKRHSIPSVEDCRACHVTNRTEVLGFTALQLSTDRDPHAPNAETPLPGAITAATLVEEGWLQPARPELVSSPPRIHAPDARTRAVLGMLSANCGNCHNASSSIANLGLLLRQPAYGSAAQAEASVERLLRRTGKWQVPGTRSRRRLWTRSPKAAVSPARNGRSARGPATANAACRN